jgi:hypothetical protein
LPENTAKMPTSRHAAKTLKSLPQNWGGDFFCLELVGVEKVLQSEWRGRNWFTVVVENFSPSRFAPMQYVHKTAYKTLPLFLHCFIDQRMGTRPKRQGALC